MHFDFFAGPGGPSERYRSPHSPPVDPFRILRYRDPDLVLIKRSQRRAVQQMERASQQWTLLYQDSLAQLWGRRTKFDDPESPEYLAPVWRQFRERPQQGIAAWPAAPRVDAQRRPVSLTSQTPQRYPDQVLP